MKHVAPAEIKIIKIREVQQKQIIMFNKLEKILKTCQTEWEQVENAALSYFWRRQRRWHWWYPDHGLEEVLSKVVKRLSLLHLLHGSVLGGGGVSGR